MLMERAKSHAFWQQVRNDPACSEIRELIRSWYDANRCNPLPCLPYKARMRFYSDGDRSEFEKVYFSRRTFLGSAAFLALIYPEEETYLDEVQERILAICCEYSWALPAHTDGTLEDDLHRIDLFSAETGFTLAEICYILEDRLDKLVLDRARSEIRSRVIANFVSAPQKWENYATNWAAVCAGNVGGAMMYLEPEAFDQQLPRLLDTMRVFLSGFPNDGTCLEGFSYWHYGFGNFLWFADLLYQYTDGGTDLLTWDKVEAVAGYAQRSFLTGGTTVSNADGTASGSADRAMIRSRPFFIGKDTLWLPRPGIITNPITTTMWAASSYQRIRDRFFAIWARGCTQDNISTNRHAMGFSATVRSATAYPS